MGNYSLIDSGDGSKLESFGGIELVRPCAAAAWRPTLARKRWEAAVATFWRDPDNQWTGRNRLPTVWEVEEAGLRLRLQATDFGHLGIFPEQRPFWEWIQATLQQKKGEREEISVLNLFAYSGGSTLAAAKGGASVCHVDASQGMVEWARENAAINKLDKAPIRWIVDDVTKFLTREERRGRRYDAIILDPPTFGRGKNGELFKIEEDLPELLQQCRRLLSEKALFILLSCHTPGYSPTVLRHLLSQTVEGLGGGIDDGEMLLTGGEGVLDVPSGTFARWING